MQFDVKVGTQRRSAVAYCFLRILDLWPHAVLVSGRSVVRSPAGCKTLSTTNGTFYRSSDEYLAAGYFSCPVPHVDFSLGSEVLEFEGDEGGEDMAEKLASLPFWSHKVGSGRLEAVG